MTSDPRAIAMNPKLWNTWVAPRNVYFAFLVLGAVVVFWRPLVAVFGTAFYIEQYSHILLILPVSVALLYGERPSVFRNVKYCLPAGFLLLLLAAMSIWVRHPLFLSLNDALSLRMALFVAWLIMSFVFCFGVTASRVAAFPLLFLLLMVPIPDLLLDRSIWLLQRCSTDVTFLLLKAANIPVLRTDFVLSLPGIDIEVAKECSGIRSSLILLIVTLVLGHLFLQPGWKQILLGLLVFPITVLKNGLRIFTLCTLGVYVDPSFLEGNLHHHGGILFFSLALGLVILAVWWLRKTAKRAPKSDQHYPGSSDLRPL